MNMTTPFTLPSCTPPRAYTPSPCSCQRCKKDNQCPKLFSSDNNMDPGSVPAELLGLSQTEKEETVGGTSLRFSTDVVGSSSSTQQQQQHLDQKKIQ